jgi:hypothetical protein
VLTVAALACGGGALLLAPSPASAATSGTTTATYDTPGNGAFTVPAGVYRIYVTAAGGGGGDGGLGSNPVPCVHGYGGAAGQVSGYFAVEPGDTVGYTVAGGGHVNGTGGYDTLLGGGTGGSDDGGGIATIGGNGGGGGGASSVSVDGIGILVAGGGGGAGGRGTSSLVCGGDGGDGGQPPTKGYNGTIGGAGYAYGATFDAPHDEIAGTDAAGGSGGGGGGGGGDGAQPGGGGGADYHAFGGGGGGGGAGGSSIAYRSLQDAAFSTTGGHGSDGSVAFSWGAPTTTTVPDVSGYGAGIITLHAVVGDTDGGGTVDFSYPTAMAPVPVPGCTDVPLTGIGDGVTFEANCDVAASQLPADSVTATYSGDEAYQTSNGTGQVALLPSASTLSLTADPVSVQPGDLTRLTTIVTADTGGSVTVLDENSDAGCTADLAPYGTGTSIASCLATVPEGLHTFTASYTGDRDFTPGSSAPVTVSAVAGNPPSPIGLSTASAPGAPTIETTTAADRTAAVAFTPPIDGGSPITGYTATATPVAGGAPVTATGTSSPITITGLTDGTAYTITVSAANAIGTGPASSPSTRITPAAAAPDLAVTLAPIGDLVHGRTASYAVTVTNAGTAATSAPTVVRLALAKGLTARGATAPGWHCTRRGVVCSHRAPLAAGEHLRYVVRVHVGTAIGKQATSSARVTPLDTTPSDNLGTTTATVIRWS